MLLIWYDRVMCLAPALTALQIRDNWHELRAHWGAGGRMHARAPSESPLPSTLCTAERAQGAAGGAARPPAMRAERAVLTGRGRGSGAAARRA